MQHSWSGQALTKHQFVDSVREFITLALWESSSVVDTVSCCEAQIEISDPSSLRNAAERQFSRRWNRIKRNDVVSPQEFFKKYGTLCGQIELPSGARGHIIVKFARVKGLSEDFTHLDTTLEVGWRFATYPFVWFDAGDNLEFEPWTFVIWSSLDDLIAKPPFPFKIRWETDARNVSALNTLLVEENREFLEFVPDDLPTISAENVVNVWRTLGGIQIRNHYALINLVSAGLLSGSIWNRGELSEWSQRVNIDENKRLISENNKREFEKLLRHLQRNFDSINELLHLLQNVGIGFYAVPIFKPTQVEN
jgi:hypothetical protein